MKTRSVEFLESYSVGSAAGSGSPSTGILDQKFADYTDKAIFARIAVSKIDCKRNALSLRGKDHERRHIAFFARGLVDNETLPSLFTNGSVFQCNRG